MRNARLSFFVVVNGFLVQKIDFVCGIFCSGN